MDHSHEPSFGSEKYTKKDYWDDRFAQEDSYEWLATWSDIAPLIQPYVSHKDIATLRVLLLGNGTSRLPLQMAEAGYGAITATDYSEVCVARMREATSSSPYASCITWRVADMCDLPRAFTSYPPPPFDLIIDKAAMDAVLAHGADVWSPPARLLALAGTVMAGAATLLAPGAHFLQLSFSQPHFRRAYLLGPNDTTAGTTTSSTMTASPSPPATGEHGKEEGEEREEAESDFEPDRTPHLTPHYPLLAPASSSSASYAHARTAPPPPDSPWASFTVHDVPVGLGYFLYVLQRK